MSNNLAYMVEISFCEEGGMKVLPRSRYFVTPVPVGGLGDVEILKSVVKSIEDNLERSKN